MNKYVAARKNMLLGNSGVGKTSLCKRAKNEGFSQHYRPTDGFVCFSIGPAEKVDEEDVTPGLVLCDLAGRERYGNMTKALYWGSSGALICWDLPGPMTYQAALEWYTDYISKVKIDDGEALSSDKAVPIAFVATKFDLTETGDNIGDLIKRHDFREQAQKLLEKVQEISHQSTVKIYITSSKDNLAYCVTAYKNHDKLQLECSEQMFINAMMADYANYDVAQVKTIVTSPTKAAPQKASRPGFSMFSYNGAQYDQLERLQSELNERSAPENVVRWLWSCVPRNGAHSTGQKQAAIKAILNGDEADVRVVESRRLGNVGLAKK